MKSIVNKALKKTGRCHGLIVLLVVVLALLANLYQPVAADSKAQAEPVIKKGPS